MPERRYDCFGLLQVMAVSLLVLPLFIAGSGRSRVVVGITELGRERVEFDDLAISPNDDRRVVLSGALQHNDCCLIHCRVGLFYDYGRVIANHGNSSGECRLISARVASL